MFGDDPRKRIDAENRFPAPGLLTVEYHALKVLDELFGAELSRTRDAIQLDYMGEAGIVVLVTAEALELRLPTVEWTQGAYGPAASSRMWKRVLWDDISDDDLPTLLEAALQARQDEYVVCRFCGESVPPEHRIDEDVCHGCASKHLGVMF